MNTCDHTASYKKLGGRRSWQLTSRGFKLSPKRLSVRGLRARFMCLFRVFSRSWRCSYGRALRALKNRFGTVDRNTHHNNYYSNNSNNNNNQSTSRRWLVREDFPSPSSSLNGGIRADCRFRSLGRSNSFYAEAIADCLEFIKRSSISVDQNPMNQR